MQKKTNSPVKATRYTTPASSVTPPLGMSALDHYRRTPGASLPRTFEMIRDNEERTFQKSPDFFVTAGVVMGMGVDGLARPYEPGQTNEVLGILVGDTGNACTIKTRGSVILTLDGLDGLDHGKPVFVLGPDAFTLDGDLGGTEFGAIRYAESARRAAVAFRRSGDSRPLSLDVRTA